jgi:hypothetical protein
MLANPIAASITGFAALYLCAVLPQTTTVTTSAVRAVRIKRLLGDELFKLLLYSRIARYICRASSFRCCGPNICWINELRAIRSHRLDPMSAVRVVAQTSPSNQKAPAI